MASSHNNFVVPPRGDIWRGALAGAVATLPMTLFMLATQRFLPRGQRYDLPPEIITRDMARVTHTKPFLNKKQILVATLLSHFGYGSVMGILYRQLWRQPLLKEKSPLSASLQGLIFGFIVWAGSYLGLLPLLRFSTSGPQEPGQRNLMMIAAHEVWGATLGVTTTLLTPEND